MKLSCMITRLPSLFVQACFTPLFAAVLVLGSVGSDSATAQDRPNFVIIMADDMGYNELSCYGNEAFETPCIDQLAAEGLRWTDYHSNGSVCSPTRAALVTGRYQQRAGIPGVVRAGFNENRHHGLHADEITFAEILSDAGYATTIIGKWHLGYHPQFNPTLHGFDQFRGFISGNIDYQTHLDKVNISDWWHDTELTEEEGYTTHLITQHAVNYIAEHANADRPFCLYVPHESPHKPFQGPNDPPVRGPNAQPEPRGEDARRAQREMIIELDRGVGEIVAALKSHGIAENTLVLFVSDNGSYMPGSNAPLQGQKGSLHEGGHRVPAIAWWPGQIDPGTVTDETALSLDIYPTMLDFAEVEASTERPLDGVSLKEVLLGNGPLPERRVYWHYNWSRARVYGDGIVRDGPWKLWVNSNARRPMALYNLESDLAETTDVAADHPDRVASMLADYLEWHEDVHHNASPQPSRPTE